MLFFLRLFMNLVILRPTSINENCKRLRSVIQFLTGRWQDMQCILNIIQFTGRNTLCYLSASEPLPSFWRPAYTYHVTDVCASYSAAIFSV